MKLLALLKSLSPPATLLFLLSVFLLSSCMTSPQNQQEKVSRFEQYATDNKLESIDKIRSFRFSAWRELDRKHLIISTSVRKPYFITLKGNCLNLQFTNTIGIDNLGSSLTAGFDSIFVLEFPQLKCRIQSIHRLTKQQADDMTDLRKQKDPEPASNRDKTEATDQNKQSITLS